MPDDHVIGLPPRQGHSERVHIPLDDWVRFRTIFWRALRLRCPYCGGRGVFKSWFDLRETCPTCGTRFEREDGYFLGGYALNLIVAEFLAIGAIVVYWLLASPSVLALQIVGVTLAAGLPILFFPFSRCLWMALDLQLHPPGRDA
jgi:uncharacterized protein (DUF983 family)